MKRRAELISDCQLLRNGLRRAPWPTALAGTIIATAAGTQCNGEAIS